MASYVNKLAAWIAVGVAACGGGTGQTSVIPSSVFDDDAGVVAAKPPRVCLPKDVGTEKGPGLQLVRSEAGPLLCLLGADWVADKKYDKCYQIGADLALVAHPAPTALPKGVGVALGDGKTFTVEGSDGKHHVVVTADHIEIHDSTAAKQLARFAIYGEASDSDDPADQTISAEVAVVYMIGDTVFAVDHDAGPHADVHGFRADGKSLGMLVEEVYNGAISILSDRTIAFADAGMANLYIYDTKTAKMQRYGRKVSNPSECSEAQISDYLVEPSMQCDPEYEERDAKCCAALDESHGAYMNASVGMLSHQQFLLVLAAPLGHVAVFDARTGTVGARKSLLCD